MSPSRVQRWLVMTIASLLVVGISVVTQSTLPRDAAPARDAVGSAEPGPDGVTPGQPVPGSSGVAPSAARPTASAAPRVVVGAPRPLLSSPGTKGVPVGPTGPTGPAGTGRGVTATSIKIGITWLDLTALVAAAKGLGSQNAQGGGSSKDVAQKVVDDLNRLGGIAGRKIAPVYYEFPIKNLVGSPAQRREAEQQMCATYTEDNRVFAMIPYISFSGVIADCARKADTPMVAVSNIEWSMDQQLLATGGQWWYRPNWMGPEEREATMAERLVASGFFPKGAKVGIMVEDKPQFRRGVDKVLRPALKARGVDVTSVVAYPDEIDSAWNSYVLQMQSAGVTHVIWAHCGCSGLSTAVFMRAAQSQQWHPKYALATDTSLYNVLYDGAPEEQLVNVTGGIAWNPWFDHPAQQLRTAPITAADRACRRIGPQTDNEVALMYTAYCEGLFFLKASIERSTAFTSGALAKAVNGFGRTFAAVSTPSTSFGPHRHAGTASVYDIRYDKGCACFAYVRGPFPAAA